MILFHRDLKQSSAKKIPKELHDGYFQNTGDLIVETIEMDNGDTDTEIDHQESIMKVERKSLQYVINYLQFLY